MCLLLESPDNKKISFFKSSLDSDCLKLSLTCPLEGSRRFVDKTMGNNKLQNPNQCIGMYYIEDAESKRLNIDQLESINKKKKKLCGACSSSRPEDSRPLVAATAPSETTRLRQQSHCTWCTCLLFNTI